MKTPKFILRIAKMFGLVSKKSDQPELDPMCYNLVPEGGQGNAVCATNRHVDIDLDDPDEPRM